MKYSKTLMAVIASVTLVATSAFADSTNTVETSDSWNLSLNGVGSTQTKSPSTSAVGIEFALGKNVDLLLPDEVGVRQTVSYQYNGADTFGAGTRVYNDWRVLKLGNLQVFAGGNIGADYGQATTLDWQAAPEAVVKYFIKKDVFVQARGSYGFDLTTNTRENRANYFLGLGCTF